MKYSSLPLSHYEQWAKLNGIDIHGVTIRSSFSQNEDENVKGGGIEAVTEFDFQDQDDTNNKKGRMLEIPAEMILNREMVDRYSKIDGHFKELVDVMGEFVLLTVSSLDCGNRKDYQKKKKNLQGVKSAMTEYVRFLPKTYPLPTFYNDEETNLLRGTSLADALEQKRASLTDEFEMLRNKTEGLAWCRDLWWGNEEDRGGDGGCLDLSDWVLVDAMYRSRALELPGDVGDAMVPMLDMANHASDNKYTARFDVDRDTGSVILVGNKPGRIGSGDEVTIMYGRGGACEMVFSYGFLDKDASSAREVFLSLTIPEDDPLRKAKIHFAEEAPGVRIYVDSAGQVRWESGLIWWAVVNEEDGLDFELAQRVDGERELTALWKGEEFKADELHSKIMADEDLRDIFVLRALVLIQERVEAQGSEVANSEDWFESRKTNSRVRELVWQTIKKLRTLEFELFVDTYRTLEAQKIELMNRANVRAYLESSVKNTS